MDEFEKEDEQLEVEVELYALDDDGLADDEDFEFAEDSPEAPIDASPEGAQDAFDSDEALEAEDLGSTETVVDAESFDPDEAPANAIVDAEDAADAIEGGAAIGVDDEVDELSDSIDISVEEKVAYTEDDDEDAMAEKAARSRRRLRNVLIFFIVVLVIIGAAIGVFVWRNSTPPDIKQTDPDAMQASKAGATVEVFQPIEADQIPDLVAYFGMTPEEAAEASGAVIALDADATPTTDEAIPALKSLRNGWVVGKSGDIAVSLSFGLDKDNKIIYTLASFDLDAFGVADARFNELASSRIVAASVLAGLGLESATIDSSQLTIIENPAAVTSRDTAAKEVAEFSGTTNLENAPKEWKLTETYDHTAGASLGDNSVIRTLDVDLR